MSNQINSDDSSLLARMWVERLTRKREHLNIMLFGVVGTFLVSVIQLIIGANFLVISSAAFCALIVTWAIARDPRRIEGWFSAAVFFQLFGFALIYKTLTLVPFEDGLLEVGKTMFLGTLVVCAGLGAALVARKLSHRTEGTVGKEYRDFRLWSTLGVILLAIGELSIYASYFVNLGGFSSGGFAPFTQFAIAGSIFLSAAAARKGRVFDWRIGLVLGLAVVDTLIFNAKGNTIFRVAGYFIATMAGNLSVRSKLRVVGACFVMLLFADRVLFPAVHLMRAQGFRDAPISERIAIISTVLVGDYKWEDVRLNEGDIWVENLRFIPTDSLFMARFGSLAYLDITVHFGEPGSYKISFLDFAKGCVVKAIPGPWSPGKEYTQLSDKIWETLDSRMNSNGFVTMGSFASARLLFGNIYGLVAVVVLWITLLWLFIHFYGCDVRLPLVQFVIVGVFYQLIDTDIENISVYLMRLFWQDLAVFILVIWAAKKLHGINQMDVGLRRIHAGSRPNWER